MLVFCNGMPRSASTWSFHVVKALLERCFPGESVSAGFSDAPVQFLRAVGPEARHVVIKCHSLTPLGKTLVRTRAVKVIFTTRDVADAVASAMAAFAVTFENAIEVITPAVELRTFHSQSGNAVIVPYEEVLARPLDAIRRIGEYLDCRGLTGERIAEIADFTSLEQMRKKVEQLHGAVTDPKLGPDLQDPETLLHPNHIGDARIGKGREILSTEQLARIAALERDAVL